MPSGRPPAGADLTVRGDRRARRSRARRPGRGSPRRSLRSCCCTASRRTRPAGRRSPRPCTVRGCGRWPPTSAATRRRRARPTSSAYRVGELARDVLAVLDAAGVDRAHVVGHDWGGAVAWHLGDAPRRAGRLPHRAVDAPPRRPRPLDDPVAGSRCAAGTRSRCRFRCCPSSCWRTRCARRCACRDCRPTSPSATPRGWRSPSALRGPLAWYRAAARRPPWEPRWAVAARDGVDRRRRPHDVRLGLARPRARPCARPRRRATTSPATTSSSSWTPATGCPSCTRTRWPGPSSTASSAG